MANSTWRKQQTQQLWHHHHHHHHHHHQQQQQQQQLLLLLLLLLPKQHHVGVIPPILHPSWALIDSWASIDPPTFWDQKRKTLLTTPKKNNIAMENSHVLIGNTSSNWLIFHVEPTKWRFGRWFDDDVFFRRGDFLVNHVCFCGSNTCVF